MAINFYNQADQDIYAGGEHFIPQERYRLNYMAPSNMPVNTNTLSGINSIPRGRAYFPQMAGAGTGGVSDTSDLISNFYSDTANRQNRLENPNWIQSQINNLGFGQRSVKDMVSPPSGNFSRSLAHTQGFGLDALAGSGQYGNMPGVIEGDERSVAQLPWGMGAIINKMIPDRYYGMDPANQAYIQSQMGYSGPTVFGENNMGNVDPFGRNVRSALGDYGAKQEKDMAKLEDYWGGEVFAERYGPDTKLEQDEEGNWSFVGKNAAAANKMNKMNLARYNFDYAGLRNTDIIKQNAANQKKMRAAWERETGRELDAADKRFQDTGDYDEYSGACGTPRHSVPAGTYSYEGSDEQDKANEGSSFGGGKGSMPTGTEGRNPWGRAQGGRVGLYAGGDPEEPDENIYEFMQDQGIPYGEMASAVDPMDALNDMSMDIFGKPLHELTGEEYQMLIDMANDQASADQPEGLASLV